MAVAQLLTPGRGASCPLTRFYSSQRHRWHARKLDGSSYGLERSHRPALQPHVPVQLPAAASSIPEPSLPAVQADSIIEPGSSATLPPTQLPEHLSDKRALLAAAVKAPMYSVGLAPILVSAAAAFIEHGALSPLRTLSFCLGAICVIAWLNLSNDVFDSTTGGLRAAGRPPGSWRRQSPPAASPPRTPKAAPAPMQPPNA